MRLMQAATLAICAGALCACTRVGQLRNLEDTACSAALSEGVANILLDQGEDAEDALRLARQGTAWLAYSNPGPRPFSIAAPSGTDYHFIVQPTKSACQLRLYGRVRGFTRVTNNLTWIESRALPDCDCELRATH